MSSKSPHLFAFTIISLGLRLLDSLFVARVIRWTRSISLGSTPPSTYWLRKLHTRVSLLVLSFAGLPDITILLRLEYCSKSHCDFDDSSSSVSCLTLLDSSFMVSLRSFVTALTDWFTTFSVGVFFSTSITCVTSLSWIFGI